MPCKQRQVIQYLAGLCKKPHSGHHQRLRPYLGTTRETCGLAGSCPYPPALVVSGRPVEFVGVTPFKGSGSWGASLHLIEVK